MPHVTENRIVDLVPMNEYILHVTSNNFSCYRQLSRPNASELFMLRLYDFTHHFLLLRSF